jgi:hypothetical protein
MQGPAAQPNLPHLNMPAHRAVRSNDVYVHGTLAAAVERAPTDFPDLLLSPGVGAWSGGVSTEGGTGLFGPDLAALVPSSISANSAISFLTPRGYARLVDETD